MIKNQMLSGGPEEDRTPDLLIANEATVNDFNNLDPHCSAINSGKTGGECTNRAQLHTVRDHRVSVSASVAPESSTRHNSDRQMRKMARALTISAYALLAGIVATAGWMVATVVRDLLE